MRSAYIPQAEKPEAERNKRLPPITRNRPAFTRIVRKRVFDILKALGNRQWTDALALIEPNDHEDQAWTASRLEGQTTAYLESHDLIRLDPKARNRKHTYIDEEPKQWRVEQVLVAREELNDWA